ncbi:uncharacterized protein [Aphelocoma coerulescens]|uniref:uncharacterized protein n=1 Tax=Aphelocoma coerulescens TaxID=39617 RepID=UPI0036052F20
MAPARGVIRQEGLFVMRSCPRRDHRGGLTRATPPARALRRGHVVPRASRDRGGGGGAGAAGKRQAGPGRDRAQRSRGPARALRAASPPWTAGTFPDRPPAWQPPPPPSAGPAPRPPRRSVTRRRLRGSSVVRRWRQPRDGAGPAERPAQVPEADSDPCSHRCYRFSQNLPFHVREQQLEDVLKRLHRWSVSLLECWPGFGRSQVAWSSEVFPVRNPCWGCFPWLSQGEGTALEFLQPQAGDASPENQFRIVHLTLSLTCGFQGAFWSSGYSQERIFHHLTFKPGIANPVSQSHSMGAAPMVGWQRAQPTLLFGTFPAGTGASWAFWSAEATRAALSGIPRQC